MQTVGKHGRRKCEVYRVAGSQVDFETKQAYTGDYNIRMTYPELNDP